MTTLVAMVGASSVVMFLGLLTLVPLGWMVILLAATIGAP